MLIQRVTLPVGTAQRPVVEPQLGHRRCRLPRSEHFVRQRHHAFGAIGHAARQSGGFAEHVIGVEAGSDDLRCKERIMVTASDLRVRDERGARHLPATGDYAEELQDCLLYTSRCV